MKCVICQGELCQCSGSCKVLQTITDEELMESKKGKPND